MTFVTGASGLLGANFVIMAQGRGENLAAASHRHAVRLPGVLSVQVDLSDKRAAREVVRRFKPQWIVHCAALTDVDRCEEFPEDAMRTNVDMPRILAEEARNVDA